MNAPNPLPRRQFASDNYAGVIPEVWEALEHARLGHAPAYGDDPWTDRASDLLREFFETDCEVYFVFNGTAANSLALAALCNSYHSVICHAQAHVETDECGAPEFFSNGTKVLLADGANGKIDPTAVENIVNRRKDIHYPKPRVLSVTQATEMGTVYQPDELAALCDTAKRHHLRLHLDGARLSNALASLGKAPADVTWRLGIDVLCFGGTKIGMPVGEAVIFFNKELAHEFEYRCKQSGQLASKMRFLSAPWIGLLESNAWLKHAQSANACAAELGKGIESIDGVSLLAPVEANACFVQMPEPVAEGLRAKGWKFYGFIANGGARFMCSWDTSLNDVNALLDDIRELTR
ncbi:threonine aldolase family protein [Blastopirellula retiformator]|uniref:L-threonine aldolase n=1 Tax=Blastopirellula retiformator TaxID=2527970 RepID=A0A5C5V118_9BACT|nr:low specificity L-threonine aldolase [Blastopirellula retiformator]TWT31719.1 Low specificity L-threonine aldolase [Blastopirellula retiformator]